MAKKKVTKKATKKAPAKKAAPKATKKVVAKAAPKAAKKVVAKAAPKATKKVVVKAVKKVSVKSKRKPNAAFMRPLTPSDALAKVVGSTPLPRTEVIKRIWAYIKKHNLQNPTNRRNIVADDNLRIVFGKGEVSMFEMTKLVSNHLK